MLKHPGEVLPMALISCHRQHFKPYLLPMAPFSRHREHLDGAKGQRRMITIHTLSGGLDRINGIAVRAEMPAVLDRNRLSFDKGKIQSQIRADLPEQFVIHLHLHFQRL